MSFIQDKFKGFSKIWVQSHDHPDADSIASCHGMAQLLDILGFDTEIIYFGNSIVKPNLTEMLDVFNISMENKGRNFTIPDTDLLLIMDGQRGSRNVYSFPAKNVAVIDHHNIENHYDYYYSDIQSKIGSCSTVVHGYYKSLGVQLTSQVATCLYYGLLMDTNTFVVKYTSLDAESKEQLELMAEEKLVTKLLRTSFSFLDVSVLNLALSKIEKYGDIIYSNIGKAEDNLLGHISDIMSEIAGVNIVVLYSDRGDGYKFSIRSYHEYVTAENIIQVIVNKIGSGGGHMNKAGGYIGKNSETEAITGKDFYSFVKDRTKGFMNAVQSFTEGKDNPLLGLPNSGWKISTKRSFNVRVIKLSNYFSQDEQIEIKTLEGSLFVNSSELVIIGAKGEIYPVSKIDFEEKYFYLDDDNAIAVCDEHMAMHGITLSGNETSIKVNIETVSKFPVAVSDSNEQIYSLEVDTPIKVIRANGEQFSFSDSHLIYKNPTNYYLLRSDVFHDIYEEILPLTEEEIESSIGVTSGYFN